ncbi:MAG: hypothetical protein ACPMAQ_12750 [Phycisphaerae bacterium]
MPYGVIAVLAAAAVGFVFWRAWVCDDAFITFRYVANCLAGYGPVFNVGERVQGFTHPLWFGLLLAGGLVFDVYAFAVAAGLALTAAAVLALAWLVHGRNQATLVLIAAVGLLLASRSFVEFQTSGLETSLTNLLVLLLFAVVLRDARAAPATVSAGLTAWLCSLLLLTRPDHLVICGPVLAWTCVQVVRRPARLRGFATAWVPLIAWYGFAAVYYGTPLPNTAYAKVALPLPVAAASGGRYVWDYAQHEPLHAAAVACALLGGTVWSVRRVVGRRPGAPAVLCLMIGLWLDLVYVIGVGGDFMRGRFLLPLLVGATAIGAWCLTEVIGPRPREGLSPAVLGTAAVSEAGGRGVAAWRVGSPGVGVWRVGGLGVGVWRPLLLVAVLAAAGLASLWDARARVASQEAIDAAGGIADEHAWYAGRWNENRFRPPAQYPNPYTPLWVKVGDLARRYAEAHGPVTIMWQAMGILPYRAGPKVRVIDQYGLTDAFIARCPADPNSRIGHVDRDIPTAYLEARGVLGMLRNWGPRMEAMDPTLAADAAAMARTARWDDPRDYQRWRNVQRMISGDVFTWERLSRIPAYTLGWLN